VTIVASVKVHDGIAMGADSMTQIWGTNAEGQNGLIKAYDHAQKLFPIAGSPVAVMTYGIGNIGPRSIGSFIVEFARGLGKPPQVQVKEIADGLFTLFQKAHEAAFGQLEAAQRPALGVLLGGYSTGQPWAEEWEFILPTSGSPQPVRPREVFGAAWRGVAVPFNRTFFGFDPRLAQDLSQAGLQQDAIMTLSQKYATPVVFDGMPVQEAIDFVGFILQTTINSARFEVGAASCGGPLWIGIITPDEGFKWIERHEFQHAVGFHR